jgi:hypothetical protein
MTARLHDQNGKYLQRTEVGFSAPPILTLTREREQIAGTAEFTPRRRVKFRLVRTEGGSPIYHQMD